MNRKIEMRMNPQQKWLFRETMQRLDAQYSMETGMLTRSFQGREFHDLRGSCHYALGLLVRSEKGDLAKAETILRHVLDAQFTTMPDAGSYGSFPFDDRVPEPPAEPFPGDHFDAHSRFYLEKWQEQMRGRFLRHLKEADFTPAQTAQIEQLARQSLLETVPVVWGNYDANWREFIITEFAMMLALCESQLPHPLIEDMEQAARLAVEASIRRFDDHVIPMNTNVELMHVFICGFFGERLKEDRYLAHARSAAEEIARKYHETGSFAEYNSVTYNSVNLVVLAMWRLYLKDPGLMLAGCALEAGQWENIAQMYHPGLHNVCGPYARNYDNDMMEHSMMPALFYIAYGDEKPKPAFTVETAGFIDLAINGTEIPEKTKEAMRTFAGPRSERKTFRELIERGNPDDDTTLCSVTAYLADDWMLGAMAGSRNTSGQLRSAVAFWKAPDGSLCDMSLLRRMPGGREGEHLWTVYFNGVVQENRLHMEVMPDVDRDIEVFFALKGNMLTPDMIQPDCWSLPGMEIDVETNAGEPQLRVLPDGMEVVYSVPYRGEERNPLHFEMVFSKT